MQMKDSILKSIATAFLAIAFFAVGAPLEKNVEDVEAARIAIEAAINAKGGVARGGLINAAQDIINIVEKTEFECSYVAWSNVTVTAYSTTTNSQQQVISNQYSYVLPVCYQTNIVGESVNALITNDGEAEVWNKIAEMTDDE